MKIQCRPNRRFLTTFCGLALFLLALGVSTTSAQCVETPTDPCVSIHQSLLDRAARAVDELQEARKVIAAFSNERVATEAERSAYRNLAATAEATIAIFQKGVADRDTVIALQQKALEAMATLTEKILQQAGKSKSGWQKFLDAIKTVVTLAAGIALGRAGI
jgi:hypothetical protein